MENKDYFPFLVEEISVDMVEWLMRDFEISLPEAISMWYNSETFEKVAQRATGMYRESSSYNYEYFKKELRTGRFQAL